jgi:hypothetical protein
MRKTVSTQLQRAEEAVGRGENWVLFLLGEAEGSGEIWVVLLPAMPSKPPKECRLRKYEQHKWVSHLHVRTAPSKPHN